MTSPDLVALIPVHKEDPNITKKNGWNGAPGPRVGMG
jgi:hypothetical protein